MKTTSYGDPGFSQFVRKAFSRNLGYSSEDLRKPIIGICNTESEVNRCHAHFGPLVEAVKRGVLMAGGIPMEFPTISLGELYLSPTSMLFRNLAAMDTEEMIAAQPLDGVVLLCGCDKTTPAQLMGAASANIPSIMVTGGPMLNGEYEGRTLGACTDCRFFWQEHRAGEVDEHELDQINQRLAPSDGHCMVMGSASTMASCAEALGMMLPGGAAIPATHNLRKQLAEESGKKIVELVKHNVTPSQIMTYEAFENAIRVLMAIGGSTNAVIHLIAIAGRLGIDIPLHLYDKLSKETPFLANLRPSGKYQMEDFFKAGGVAVVMKELESLLHTECLTVTGKMLKDNLAVVKKQRIPAYEDIIRTIEKPLHAEGGIAVLYGNLTPNGAVIKPKAATERMLTHEGRAVVFNSIEDLEQRIDQEDLDINADDVLVLRNAGPIGGPGMPEAGMLPIPKKLLAQGVRDMVRISDCRMSGTAGGTVVLHITPEAAVGGPLSLVQSGDRIRLDVPNRSLELLVSDEVLDKRRESLQITIERSYPRGYGWLFQQHVMQADKGCDFDFLQANFQSEKK
ncbi:IlvD/Edd family dehydratase [Paenibacillus sp. FSL H7-0331]|uniref:IlvD/Edd family dehydratase n=1 Tax=Paenibacillus sp. FSL H7-0331 TaxID=1920421 RepID=UPI00096CA4EC|nr:IlvD/Edd family dehydratase [Paenibacillus sp. FSL H7-0331]OMF06982.1 dihydroxy-acid dehydratase [Paenibacillus sp. FSL H7-0331]